MSLFGLSNDNEKLGFLVVFLRVLVSSVFRLSKNTINK